MLPLLNALEHRAEDAWFYLQVLGIVAGVLLQDHEVRKAEFQQLPYHRIFIMLFIELNAPDPVLESINFEVLKAFRYTNIRMCDITEIIFWQQYVPRSAANEGSCVFIRLA